jgi:hypothetical protein
VLADRGNAPQRCDMATSRGGEGNAENVGVAAAQAGAARGSVA